MVFSELVTAVNDHLSVDADRRGTEKLRARAILDALIDLQRYIVQFRVGHKTTMTEADMDTFGKAHLGNIPAFAQPTALYISTTTIESAPGGPDFNAADFDPLDFQAAGQASGAAGAGDFNSADFSSADFQTVGTGTASLTTFRRNRLDYMAWEKREPMISGRLPRGAYRYSISPMTKKFMIYPQLSSVYGTTLLFVWNGIKRTWANADTMTMPDEAAEAVAFFVKAVLRRDVDKNIQLARENERDYASRRLALYREANEALDAEKDDEENL